MEIEEWVREHRQKSAKGQLTNPIRVSREMYDKLIAEAESRYNARPELYDANRDGIMFHGHKVVPEDAIAG